MMQKIKYVKKLPYRIKKYRLMLKIKFIVKKKHKELIVLPKVFKKTCLKYEIM